MCFKDHDNALLGLEVDNIEWRSMMTHVWNCINGVSIDNAKIFAQDQLKATQSKFDVRRMGLNFEVLGVASKLICFELMRFTLASMAFPMQNLFKNVANSGSSHWRMFFIR
jgi:hypothetical protein